MWTSSWTRQTSQLRSMKHQVIQIAILTSCNYRHSQTSPAHEFFFIAYRELKDTKFERVLEWLSEVFIILYCIKYYGFGIFQYLFNLNTSCRLFFKQPALRYMNSLIVKCIKQTSLGGTFSKSCECKVIKHQGSSAHLFYTELLMDLCISLCSTT